MNEDVRISSFGVKNKTLVITDEIIRFGEQEVKRVEITAFLFSVRIIEFYKFPVGRRYYFGFRTSSGQLDIAFKTYFGIRNSYFSDLMNKLIDETWEPLMLNILNQQADLLQDGGELQFNHCKIRKEGIWVTQGNAITKKQFLISWDNLLYEKKYNRLVLNSKSDSKHWTNLYYQDTWNIEVLMALLDWLTKDGGLAELQNQKENKSKG